MKTNKQFKDVGCRVKEKYTKGPRYRYELECAPDCYGDVGEFYRDSTQDYCGGGICYIASLDVGSSIYSDDPEFHNFAYTYDDVLDICEGNKDAADYALETAAGRFIETRWEEIQEILEDE